MDSPPGSSVSPEQLENMSLSEKGRKNPGIPDAIPKPKIPGKIKKAFIIINNMSFFLRFTMYK